MLIRGTRKVVDYGDARWTEGERSTAAFPRQEGASRLWRYVMQQSCQGTSESLEIRRKHGHTSPSRSGLGKGEHRYWRDFASFRPWHCTYRSWDVVT